MSKRQQYCFNCGEPLGVYDHHPGDGPESCGQSECNRACQDAVRQERDERQWRAAEDDYERY